MNLKYFIHLMIEIFKNHNHRKYSKIIAKIIEQILKIYKIKIKCLNLVILETY